ncbi:hypothetical protein GOP47_0022036 [Adiantum capillus-veneris]|uniref:DM2 domain-containing protein n=1 Tax=Adiantum capillus-veneris TaxID=13818 RepID=A0A9D4Z6R5_ADICA|nr:hypothetical protein GOP47_0022036 [Adiantum capillus-veneris]
MARTYAAVEADDEQGWKLLRSFSSSAELIRKLRPKGFWANHASLRELEQECMRLSKFCDAEMDAGQRSSDTKELHNEDGMQSSPSRGTMEANIVTARPDQDVVKSLTKPCSPCVDLVKDALVYDWHVSAENSETVPITEVPYTELSLYSAFAHTSFVLSGVLSKEQEQLCVSIQEWKVDLTADCSLAIFAKVTNQVWVQLGKPEELYEQTIRSLQVYIQLCSMVVTESELTKTMLLEHLTTKFNYWKVKPDVSDLDESLVLMKKFNLGCLFPLEGRVLSIVMAEAGDSAEPYSENGDKPLTFKRARSRRLGTVDLQLEEVSGENTIKSSSSSEEEILTVKRHTRSRIGATAISDSGHSGLLSPSRSDSDHILLSSKLHDLKKRKANSQIDEDILVADRSQKRRTDSTKRCVLEVESGNTERPTTSLFSADDGGLQIPCGPVKDGGRVEVDCTESRIKEIMRGTHRKHRWGSEYEYLTEPFPTIRKLWNSASTVRRALDCLEKGGAVEDAQNICSVESLANFSMNEVALREFGVSQFLPTVNRQKEVAERINYYAHDGDTVVEICSQAVDYLSLLKERLTNMGKLCNYKRFMVDQSQRQDVKNWMNKEALPTGSKLLICLSLSFALWGEQSNKILDCALELKPKLIVLIAPLFSRRLDEHSTYNLVWTDAELLQNEILWPWGSMEVPSRRIGQQSTGKLHLALAISKHQSRVAQKGRLQPVELLKSNSGPEETGLKTVSFVLHILGG